MRQNDKGFGQEEVLERELTETELATICGGATGGSGNQSQDLGSLVPGGIDGLLSGVINLAGLGLTTTSTNTTANTSQTNSGLAGLLGALTAGAL